MKYDTHQHQDKPYVSLREVY